MQTLASQAPPASAAPVHKAGAVLSGRVLALLAALSAIGMLSTNIILPSFPAMAAELSVQTRQLGAILAAFFIAFAAGQLIVGPLSDRFGRKWLVIGGLTLFVAGTAIGGMADTLDQLILGRVIQALGVSAASVLSRAIARDLYDGNQLARALSLIMIAMAAAPGFSPLLGGGLEELSGWRSTFVLVGVAAALLAVWFLCAMPETHPADRRAAHSPLAVIRGYAGLLADRRFALPAISVGLIVGGLSTFFGATPAILIGIIGLSPVQLGLFFAATVLVVFAAGAMAPKLARRRGMASTALLGAGLSVAGGVILLISADSLTLASFSLAILVFLAGMGLVNPLGSAMALQPFASKAGLAAALLGFLQMLFSGIGTALTAWLSIDPVTALALILTIPSVVALIFLAALSRSLRTGVSS